MDSEEQKQGQKQIKKYKNATEFIEIQRELLQLEHQVEIDEHTKIVEENSLQELEKLGYASNRLAMKSVKCGLFGRTLITLTHPQYSNKDMNQQFINMVKLPESKISNGDNVSIHKIDQELNKKSCLLRGVVYKKTQFKYVISVDGKEDFDENSLENQLLAILIEVNEVTYNRYSKVLTDIEKISQNNKHFAFPLIEVLLNHSDLTITNTFVKRNMIVEGDLNFLKKDLNVEQKEAIQFCLSREYIGLIHGPPGTGKTMTVCELIYQATQRGMKVLACAGSNIAVDNMVERLGKTNIKVCRIGHPARMLSVVYEKCLDSQIRKTSSFKVLKELKKEYQKNLRKIRKCTQYDEKKELKKVLSSLSKEIFSTEKLCLKEVLDDSQVICCTNAGAADKTLTRELASTAFDLVVIDECAQAVEISCWIPILKGKRVVLAGDHKQLPPTIKSKNLQLELTLFDRVLQDFDDKNVCKLLKEQYRMNQVIMNWSSDAVYQGQLRAANSVAYHSISDIRMTQIERQQQHIQCEQQQQQYLLLQQQQLQQQQDSGQLQNLDLENPNNNNILLFIDTTGAKMGESLDANNSLSPDKIKDKKKSKSNIGEADLVYVIYKELLLQGIVDEEIGIITPYNAQVDLIKKLFEKNNNDRSKLEISTVDGFQGREKECIIISMVRSNPLKQVGFLSDYRRMNVAVTRAKRFVCLIGDSETITADAFLKQLFEYFAKFGELRNAMEYMGDSDVRYGLGFVEKQQQKKDKKDQQQQQQTGNLDNGGGEKSEKTKHIKNQNHNKNKNNPQKQSEQQGAQSQQNGGGNSNQNQKFHHKDQNSSLKLDHQLLNQEYTQKLKDFIKSGSNEPLIFQNLNSFQRLVLHEVADELKLQHTSIGEGTHKNVEIKKIDSQQIQQQNLQSQQNYKEIIENKIESQQKSHEQEVEEEETKNVQQKQVKSEKNKNEQQENEEQKTDYEKQKQEYTKKLKDFVSNYDRYTPELVFQNLNTIQNQIIHEVAESMKLFHTSKGKGVNKRVIVSRKDEETQNLQIADQQKKNKQQQQQAQDEDLDDDAFLDKMIQQNKFCWYKEGNNYLKKCQINVEVLGSNCKFCTGRFCMKHALAEIHGCGQAANVQAKAQFAQQYRHQISGDKKMKPSDEALFKSRLQEKINQQQNERKVKQNNKKDSKK